MAAEEEKVYTDQDMKNAIENAVLKKRVSDVEFDLDNILPKINTSLAQLSEDVHKMPSLMESIDAQTRKDLKEYMHDKFITRRDFIIVFTTMGLIFTGVNFLIEIYPFIAK